MARYVGIMYKIKKFLPLKDRLQVYHSFVQSHVNYCSLVWGFSAKSNIEALFTKQKKGLRAVIPGFINYKYKDGKIPGHTKFKFREYNILTIQSIIVLNTLLFLHKIRNYPELLPSSMIATISEESPIFGSTHESCENWLKTYDNCYFRKSLFFKGPLIIAGSNINEQLPNVSFLSIKLYKSNISRSLLALQSIGDPCDWVSCMFVLYNIVGLRKSRTTYRTIVNYTEL